MPTKTKEKQKKSDSSPEKAIKDDEIKSSKDKKRKENPNQGKFT